MSKFRIGLLTSLALAAVTLLNGLGTVDAHHAVLRFNLEEMTATADRVFLGQCVEVQETEEMIAQGMMPVTVYTFEVERAIKGKVPKRMTFRQLGHQPKRSLNKGGETMSHGRAISKKTFFQHGMKEYRVGDRVVLFLIPNYLGGKVTYPVGLYQGAFFVSQMPSGQELARNSINNLGLFSANYNGYKMKASEAKVVFPDRNQPLIDVPGISIQSDDLTRKRGALPLDAFLGVVEHIVEAHGSQKGVITQ